MEEVRALLFGFLVGFTFGLFYELLVVMAVVSTLGIAVYLLTADRPVERIQSSKISEWFHSTFDWSSFDWAEFLQSVPSQIWENPAPIMAGVGGAILGAVLGSIVVRVIRR